MKMRFQYKTFKIAIMLFLLLQFFVYGSEEMNLSTKKEKVEESSTKSIQSANLPCIAYFSTKTGNINPSLLDSFPPSYKGLLYYTNDLFLLNYNSKPEINITENPNSLPINQVWSPDGKILAWIYTQGERSGYGIEIFEKGQKSILILLSEYLVQSFAWSPRSDKIAFAGSAIKNRKLTNDGIYIIKISDKSISKIFDLNDEMFNALYWVNNSLLGCNIINRTVAKLDIEDSKSKGLLQVIFNQENSRCLKIAVSPDNNALAGIVKEKNDTNIWIFDINGNNPYKLVDRENFQQYCVAWHPTDSNLLAFSSVSPKNQYQLALFKFNTSKITYIDLKSNYISIKNISWAKDGHYIIVECLRNDMNNSSSDILIYDLENSKWINITDSKGSRDFNPVCRP